MSTAADYAGRSYDVCAFHGLVETGERLLTQELADSGGGEICTGAAKLAQRWVLRLLTARESVRYFPAEGCDFLADLRNSARNEQEVAKAFRFAAGVIQAACASEVTSTTPDDEILVEANLLAIAFVGGGGISLTIELVTAAGPLRPIILPIRTIP